MCPTTDRRCPRRCCVKRSTTWPSNRASGTTRRTSHCGWVPRPPPRRRQNRTRRWATGRPQPTPLAAILGEQIGQLVARLHRDEGVDVRLGIGVAEVRGQGHVDTVVLTDGTELAADLVVVGIGSRPATEWLQGSGGGVDKRGLFGEAG